MWTGSASAVLPSGAVQRNLRVWVVVLAWLAACAWVGQRLGAQWAPRGDVDGLLPEDHRSDPARVLVMIAADPTAEADAGTEDRLLATADRVHEHLRDRWVPIAPPAVEVQGWLDGHALLLLPLSAHGLLRDRLTDEAMSSAVASLHARLSSPLFGLTSEEPRRDLLGLRELTASDAGHPASLVGALPSGATLTPNGDLLARTGDAILMEVRPETPAALAEIERRIREVTADGPWVVDVVGPQRVQRDAAALMQARAPRVLAIALAGIGLVLAFTLRRLRASLAILFTLAGGIAFVVALGPELDPVSFPLAVLLVGFGCEGSFHMQRISHRGWPAATVLGLALVPLHLSTHPIWRQWSLAWIVAVAVVMALLRFVLPALVTAIRGEASWEDRGFLLRTTPGFGLVLTACLLGVGAWSAEQIEVRGGDRVELGPAVHGSAQRGATDAFFDPGLVVETRSVGPDPAQALLRAATDARSIARRIPSDVTRLDSPAGLVVAPEEVARRRASLAGLELAARLAKLEGMLEARGFRPAAFGEFLRGAHDGGEGPTPEALLRSPLQRWVRRYLVSEPGSEPATGSGQTEVRLFLHLRTDDSEPLPVLLDADGEPMRLRGPAAAARTDRASFKDWTGIYVVCGLWIGAFVVWLGTRSLAIAISGSVAALVTQVTVVSVMHALDTPIGPMMLPALLLVGAAAMIAAGRAGRAVDLSKPFFAMGLLTTSACQVAAGLALVASGVPAWTEVGLAVAIGSAVASGAGLFVAPGLARILRTVGGLRVTARATRSGPTGSTDDEDAP
jgi:hypothetical protein